MLIPVIGSQFMHWAIHRSDADTKARTKADAKSGGRSGGRRGAMP